MDNSFKHQYQQFTNNTKTNILMHAKSRVRNFLRSLLYSKQPPMPRNATRAQRKERQEHNKKRVNETIGFLFHGNIEHDAELLRDFEEVTRPNTDNPCGLFSELRRDWFKLLPVFFRIQRYLFQTETRKGRNRKGSRKTKYKKNRQHEPGFVIIPQTSFQRRHILIDSNGLHAFLASLKMVPMRTKTKKMTREDFTKKPSKVWPFIVDAEQLTALFKSSKCNKKFNHSILTDGVAMTLTCEKSARIISEKNQRKMFEDKLTNEKYKFVVGLDPGYRLTLGGVRREMANAAERNIRLKCGKFYRYSKEFSRNKLKKQLDAELQQKLVEDRKRYESPPSCKR